jgi:hypothetical protein
MGFKEWRAKRTSNPSDFAEAFASGLMEMIDYLAASIVVFAGRKATSRDTLKSHPQVFESYFDMESAGFDPFTKDIADLVTPDLQQATAFADAGIIHTAFRATAAFLCLLSQNEAHRCMKPENARTFSEGLYASVASRCAGRFGFHSEPREVCTTIRELVPTFRCERIVNEYQFGHGDGLAALLLHVSASEDGRTQYGFVTGSKKQSLGCAAPLCRVMVEINDSLSRCAKDLGW